MGSAGIELYAQEYFNSLNPIAERIGRDVAATISAYEDLWNNLTIKDQNQVLDETIIYPEVVLKYSYYPSSNLPLDHFPRLQLQTGHKYIVDDDSKDEGIKWRDEHSAPFSWMTRSQFDLNLTDEDDVANTSKPNITSPKCRLQNMKKHSVNNDAFVDPPNIVLGGSSSKLPSITKVKYPQKFGSDENLLIKLKNKTAILKIHTTLKSAITKSGIDCNNSKADCTEKEILVQPKTNSNVMCSSKLSKPVINKQVIAKPKTPPPPPPVKLRSGNEQNATDIEKKALLSESCVSNKLVIQGKGCHKSAKVEMGSYCELDEFSVNLKSPSKDVPKTGFDFLDNW